MSAPAPDRSTPPRRRAGRRDEWMVATAAVVALLLSPLTAVWAVVLGVATLLVAVPLARRGSRRARTAGLVAVGVLIGTAPYFVLAVAAAAGGPTPSSGSGVGGP